MKRTLSFLLTLVMLLGVLTSLPLTANATGVYNLTFEMNDEGTMYQVKQCNTYASGDIIIPDTYNELPVTRIASDAFKNCTSIRSITIPDSVTSIGNYAFYGCSSLISVIIPDGVTSIGDYAFYGCSSLISVTIPDSVTSIGACTFYKCTSLKSIVIPDSVISIGYCAFAGCKKLASIEIPDGVASVSESAFNSCKKLKSVKLGKGVTSIGRRAFKDCTSLESIEIPDNVTSMGNDAFYNCTSLASVTIGDGVTKIGSRAFDRCTSLESVKIGNGVTTISSSAFGDCISFESIEIPDSVKYIGEYAFNGCIGLTSIKIGDGVTKIDEQAFKNCTSLETVYISDIAAWCNIYFSSYYSNPLYYANKLYLNGEPVNNVVIPDGVKKIPFQAFYNCRTLTSIIIPDSVKSIGFYAFYNCTNLTSIEIPDSVTSIGEQALGYKYNSWEEKTEKIEGFTIYGFNGSAAENYAITNGFTFVGACAHRTTEWIATKQPTVYKAGKQHKECTDCGEILETAEILQLKCDKPVLKKVYNTDDYVKVTWGTVKGADKYYVYRKTGYGSYELIGTTTNKYFNDKEAVTGYKLRYIVKAENEAGYSVASNSLVIKHIDEPTLKTIANTTNGVKITWEKLPGVYYYDVYRKVSGGEYEYICTTDTRYYIDGNVESGKKYYYAIRGYRDGYVSSQSASLSIVYLAASSVDAPTSTKSGVKVTWSKVNGASGYVIYRKTGNGAYEELATVKGSTKVTYTDKTAKKGTKYYYKVKAYKGSTYSAYSNTKSVTDKF